MNTKLRLLPLAIALSVGLSTLSAQTATLTGMVKGEDGKPLKDAIVKIERKDIKGNYKTKSNKKGEWIHAGLPLGTYKLTLEVEGRDRDTVDGVRASLGDNKEINFDLEGMKKRSDALQAAASTGQVTKEMERDMSPEQKAAMEKAMKERQQSLAKNKALNDAYNQGMEAIKAQQFDVAQQAFTKASELDPKQHVVWAQLAEAHLGVAKTKTGEEKTQNEAKGFEAFAKALELNPTDAGYHNNYGLALARAGKLDEAQKELNKAAELDPASAGKYYFNLGALLTNSKQNEAAGMVFKKATEADPTHADSFYQYGLFLVSKATFTADGKMTAVDGTKEAFMKYLELQPTGSHAEESKAMLLAMDAKIDTSFQNPNAPASKKAAKKK